MNQVKQSGMSDDKYRSLLTEREAEILREEADVSEKYYYRVVTRVRDKIEGLERDIEALEHHKSLADELREIVCEDGDHE